jgi:hypothetical protein
MTHDEADPADDGLLEDSPPPPSRNAPVARQPMEQVARAMQVQAELLKQMHERTRMLEDVVKDNRRHELVINSAQALNESFQGLQRVQERLADKLEDTGGISRARFVVIALGLIALAAVGAVLTWRILEKADTLNSNLRAAITPKGKDAELQGDIAKLENRIQGLEAADRAGFRDELDKLRKNAEAIQTERDTLRRERDTAREELGAAKATLTGAQTELADAKGKAQLTEKENARLSAEALAAQKTLMQLNDLVAAMKDTKQPAGTSPPKPPAAEGDTARKPAPPPGAGEAQPSEQASPAKPVTADLHPPGKVEPDVTSTAPDPLVPFPENQLAVLNDLLKSHRGSDRYTIKKAERVGQKKLWNVVMEVSGPDNAVNKTIEAESVTFLVSDKPMDIVFEVGNVTFHQGLAGKSTKSPFFNNRYVIVVLGANSREWLAAGFPFVHQKP